VKSVVETLPLRLSGSRQAEKPGPSQRRYFGSIDSTPTYT
jgi:hypothetical protein